MEGERHGGVTGARSGRALMLPTKRLPLSRRPEDHLADPGSGAGGDGARAWREKKRRTPDNGFPAAHSAPAPCLAASPSKRRAAVHRPGAKNGGDLPRSSPSTPSIPVPPPLQGYLMPWESKRRASVGHRHFCTHVLAAGHSHFHGRRILRWRGRSPAPPGLSLRAAAALQPRRPSEQEASGQPGSFGGLRSQPGYCEPPRARLAGCDYCAVSNMYVSDITKEVRAWRSEGRNAGLSLSFRMCVTQSLFSARLIFNFL